MIVGHLPEVFLPRETVRNFDRAIEAKVMDALIPDRHTRAMWQARQVGLTGIRDAYTANA